MGQQRKCFLTVNIKYVWEVGRDEHKVWEVGRDEHKVWEVGRDEHTV